MWRARRWRYLLNLIDHLPRNTYFSQAVSNDEEHTRLILAAQEGQEKKAYHPPMAQWSMEAGILADVVDEIRALRHVTIMAAGDGKNQPRPPVPYTRPETAADRIRHDLRRAKHEALSDRILSRRHKKPEGG